ncbi:MAG: hypothetical protein AMJ53_15925, partial [Gammaproteobacteria bacterium SG8_11]
MQTGWMLRFGFALLAVFWIGSPSYADIVGNMEKALMPGQLSKAHEEFEEDCNDCHKFFEQSKQNDLCLDCHDHENVKKDIEAK